MFVQIFDVADMKADTWYADADGDILRYSSMDDKMYCMVVSEDYDHPRIEGVEIFEDFPFPWREVQTVDINLTFVKSEPERTRWVVMNVNGRSAWVTEMPYTPLEAKKWFGSENVIAPFES